MVRDEGIIDGISKLDVFPLYPCTITGFFNFNVAGLHFGFSPQKLVWMIHFGSIENRMVADYELLFWGGVGRIKINDVRRRRHIGRQNIETNNMRDVFFFF